MDLKHKKLKQSRVTIEDNSTGYSKKVLLKTYQLPNGLTELFFIDDDRHSVCLFPITEDNKVILVKQFRAGPEAVQLELPGGGLEPTEDPLKAAARELIEETGFEGEIQFLASLPYSPYSTGIRHCYLAVNCRRVKKLDLDPNEFLTVVLMELDEFKEKMRKAQVRGFEVGYLGLDKIGLL
jgi:ADP-ribose pyrophosphatase